MMDANGMQIDVKLAQKYYQKKKLKFQSYMTLIRPPAVVLYGSETWTLRTVEETRLAAFERKVLRRICGPCIDSDTGGWRILHDDELKNLTN